MRISFKGGWEHYPKSNRRGGASNRIIRVTERSQMTLSWMGYLGPPPPVNLENKAPPPVDVNLLGVETTASAVTR